MKITFALIQTVGKIDEKSLPSSCDGVIMSEGACLMSVSSSARKTELFDPTTVRNGGQRSTSKKCETRTCCAFSTLVSKCRIDGAEDAESEIPVRAGWS